MPSERVPDAEDPRKDSEWKTVKKKWTKKPREGGAKDRGTHKPRIIRARNDAIVMSKTGEQTIAEMPREINTHPDLQELGENVNKIRRTATGDLMLMFKRTVYGSNRAFKENIEKVLHHRANI